MDPRLERYHRPERSLILSGISRSGTSLLSVIVNHLPNAVCLNEVLPLQPDLLVEAFCRLRRDLVKGRPVPNKYGPDGALATDTLSKNVMKEKRRVEKKLNHDVLVSSKRNIPYLNCLDRLLELGFKAAVMIRDPVYTIGSWSRPEAAQAGFPGARIASEDLHPHWRNVPFTRQDPVERRAEAWQHYALIIREQRERIRVYTYERLCRKPWAVIEDLCAYLDLKTPKELPPIIGEPRNDDSRYPDITHIRRAVEEICHARRDFSFE